MYMVLKLFWSNKARVYKHSQTNVNVSQVMVLSSQTTKKVKGKNLVFTFQLYISPDSRANKQSLLARSQLLLAIGELASG